VCVVDLDGLTMLITGVRENGEEAAGYRYLVMPLRA
jgi:hypothetical protein